MNFNSVSLLFILEFTLRIYFITRVIKRRLPVGVSWAWIFLLFSFPFIGTIAYLYLGEYRLGKHRVQRIKLIDAVIKKIVDTFSTHLVAMPLPDTSKFFSQAVSGFFKSPVIPGNDITLLRNADEAFPQLLEDINSAKLFCDLEFYIWSDGGRADEIAEALIRAVKRNVRCRLLVDQFGSADFLKSNMSKRLKEAGVELRVALPLGLFRSLFTRPDLRVHRKIVIIDGRIAYTGSLNLADPLYFKKSSGVGHWVDAFCRIQGQAVKALGVVFLSDWCGEDEDSFSTEEKKFQFQDTAVGKTAQIQCIPSGPAIKNSRIEQVVVTAIYSARKKITLTTPYFVPDEQLLCALMAAAAKGVDVTLIVPKIVDSKLVQYASHAFLSDLAESGVRIQLFSGGLLHTKSITIDEEFSLFGSLNLDPRSLRINFEITLAVYDKNFTNDLEALQMTYIKDSINFKLDQLVTSSARFKDNLTRLVGPIL